MLDALMLNWFNNSGNSDFENQTKININIKIRKLELSAN